MDSANEPQPPTGLAGVFGPTIHAFLAPAKGFAMLDARPLLGIWPIVWTFAILVVLGLVNLDVTRQIARVGMIENMSSTGQEIDAEQLRRTLEMMDRFLPVQATVGNVFIVITVAVVALAFWIGSSMLGGSTKFSRAFAVASMGGLITPLFGYAFVTLMWYLDPPEIRRMSDFVTSMPTLGIDLVLDAGEDNPLMKQVLARIDVFNAWWVAVTVIGGERLLRLSRGGAIGLSLTVWALSVLFAVMSTALFM